MNFGFWILDWQRSAACSRVAVVAVLLLASFGGCSRAPTGPAAAASQPTQLSPRGVLERLITLRDAGKYQEMSALILPNQRRAVADTLLAVDDFLAANRQLGDYLRDHVGLGLAEQIDQSHLGANLDVFSRFVELLDERIEGDEATVSFTVDRGVPVRRAKLQRVAGVWLYDAGDGYTATLPQAFISMARGLRRMRDEIAAGVVPAETLRRDPERLMKEVRLRLMEGVRLLAPAADQP